MREFLFFLKERGDPLDFINETKYLSLQPERRPTASHMFVFPELFPHCPLFVYKDGKALRKKGSYMSITHRNSARSDSAQTNI